MSKSSTATPAKPLPVKSAWSKGPPQTSAPSPRSQSPAPSAQSQPHLTHSRRPSALGQAVPIKDGVSIPRNNIGAAAAKQGSSVTFGSIDDASAPISSSPAAPNPIKESVVRSFGTVPAAPATTSTHINGKPSISAPRPAGASVATPSTTPSPGLTASTSISATPLTATASSGPKLQKPDIKKLFQSPSAPATSTTDTQSPALRSATLPLQQQQSQNTPSSSSQGPQFGSHFTPFVPNRPPASNPSSGPNNGSSRSPVYSRQMPNGAGPRSQPPNGGPTTGLPSPRLGPPHTPQQANPPQPPAPVPGQVQAAPSYWQGYYYHPDYMAAYPPASSWGYVPGMPPQSAHPHAQHMPQPPHMPQHPTMSMSPRNPPHNLPGTPTMSHAAPNPIHPPHPPPPLPHPSNNLSNVASPPPTPSTQRLSANSSAFVPRPSSKIVLKNSDGKEVDLGSLAKTASGPPSSTAPSSGPGSPFRGSSPGTPKRHSVRIETEEQRKKRVAEEEEKEREKLRQQQEAAEKVRKEKEEAERKLKEEEERKRKEEERKKKEQEELERKRRAEEEEKEKERLRKVEEERKRIEEEERKKKEEEEERERERLRKEEEERKRKEEEEARVRKEAEERQRKEEEERKAKDEAERKAREEEEQRKQKEAEEAAKAKAKAAEETAAPEDGEVVETTADAPALKEEPKKLKETLRIDTTTAPTSNPADLGKKRPGPLDLSAAKTSRQSSLSTARHIENINAIKYPEGIQSPKPELNENAKAGHFRYDREFLLQFMSVCKEKPPNLPPLDAIGLEPNDASQLAMSRGGSGRHRNSSAAIPNRQSSVGLGFGGSGFGKPAAGNFGGMGNFGTSGKLTSEDRFAMANAGGRSASVNAASGLPFAARPAPIQRTASQGGQIRERTRSKRGEKRPPADGKGYQHDRGSNHAQNAQLMNLEPVVPLQVSANRWDRKSLAQDQDSPEVVDRKVKALLNKLTMEKFDSISDQIITWANKSEQEKDGRTLIQVIRLVFEKATDEATWSEMYARLCRKMMERISPKVQDDGITNAEGKPIAGGQLFRKYLLNRCQEDFERGWVAKETAAAAAASKAAEDDAVKAANAGKDGDTEEVALYSEEYYAAQKAKRQGLGLIKFIGELFKLQMLTERIMHECVKKLLGNVENPEEEEIESLCKLLTTVGAILDTPKARAHMDIYFSRMKELTKSPNVSSRMQFMLQDLLELRSRSWVPRNAAAAPTTLAQVHENAAKEKLLNEVQRQVSMSRTSSNRGRGRNDFEQAGPDGWAVAGGPPRPAPKAGDLTNFGKISKNRGEMSFGPTSVFSAKNKNAEKRESLSRSASSSNMFSMLSQQADAPPESKPEPQQRRKLVLQPRTVIPKENETPGTNPPSRAGSESGSDEEESAAAPPDMSDEEAKKKIEEDIKELFAVRNLDEAEVYFTALPSKHHQTLVDKIVSKAVESKATDAELVASFFERASSKELCSSSSFESGFEPIAEFIYDIALDAPKAPQLFATMVKAAGLSEQARQQIASKSPDNSDQLLALLS